MHQGGRRHHHLPLQPSELHALRPAEGDLQAAALYQLEGLRRQVHGTGQRRTRVRAHHDGEDGHENKSRAEDARRGRGPQGQALFGRARARGAAAGLEQAANARPAEPKWQLDGQGCERPESEREAADELGGAAALEDADGGSAGRQGVALRAPADRPEGRRRQDALGEATFAEAHFAKARFGKARFGQDPSGEACGGATRGCEGRRCSEGRCGPRKTGRSKDGATYGGEGRRHRQGPGRPQARRRPGAPGTAEGRLRAGATRPCRRRRRLEAGPRQGSGLRRQARRGQGAG
mmetsp:Transcript_99025/g.251378  ORF Transcript_99025/g.251378 Transcript_99025/m.251378 type:complete len:292 (-) Transcript_99025:29-904(-)